MAIVHIVLFQFKPTATAVQIQDLCSAMLSLRMECVRPDNGQAYILNSTGGSNNSPEGLHEGLSHAFSVIFANEEDRAYYLDHDPAHQKFKAQAAEFVQRAVVVDYEPSAM